MKTETLKNMISESKSVIIYHKDGSACQLTDGDVEMIVDALDRMIPKPVEISERTSNAFVSWRKYICPDCKLYLYSGAGKPSTPQKACHKCGQRISWGDEE